MFQIMKLGQCFLIIVALLSTVLSGCTSSKNFSRQNKTLKIGMCKSQVMELLVISPASTVIQNGSEYLIYTEFNRAPSFLKFTNDKLEEWGIWSVMSDKL